MYNRLMRLITIIVCFVCTYWYLQIANPMYHPVSVEDIRKLLSFINILVIAIQFILTIQN